MSSYRLMFLIGLALQSLTLSAATFPLVQWSGPSGNDHFYQLRMNDDFITWTDASANAQASGGYLATITSAAENDFLTLLSTTATGSLESWIGLTDAAIEGQFEWVTGEATSFVNWYPGEPNDDPEFNGEDYTVINPAQPGLLGVGTWNDLPDDANRVMAWIVEWDEEPLDPANVPEPSTLWSMALVAALLIRYRTAG